MSVVSSIRDVYAQAVPKMEFELEGALRDLCNIGTGDFLRSCYGANSGDPSTGQVVTGFESALDREEQRLDALVAAFNSMAADWSHMMRVMHSRLRTLNDMCASEDPASPYTLMDIPF